MSRILLAGICVAFSLTGCVFSVDHEADLSGDNDAGPTDDADTTPVPTIEFVVEPGAVTAYDELEYEFECDVDEDYECTTECAYPGGDDEPVDGDWSECTSPYTPSVTGTDEGDFTFYIRAVADDEVSEPDANTTSLRWPIALGSDDLPDSGNLLDPRLGDVALDCDRPAESQGCQFTVCRMEDGVCTGEGCDFDCAGEVVAGEDAFILEEFQLSDVPDSISLNFEVCAPEFEDHDVPHCAELKHSYSLIAPQWSGVATGDSHACAIAENDDSLWCWGNNEAGQVGVGSTDATIAVATRVDDHRWKQVSAGNNHTCAIDIDDNLYCWGANDSGRLGFESDGTDVPQKVDDGAWKTVSAGYAHTCAIDAEDGLFCWGYNSQAQLGNPDAETGTTMWPVDLPEDATQGWIAVATGGTFTCAITHRDDGGRALYCWGNTEQGQLGINEDSGDFAEPQEVIGDAGHMDTEKVSTGALHTCAILTNENDRDTYCWGEGANGRLGLAVNTRRLTPSRVIRDEDEQPDSDGYDVINFDDFFAIAGGEDHTCATHEDGAIYCWGANDEDQLGTGAGDADQPARTTTPAGVDYDRIATGSKYTCAIDTDDFLYCWGFGDDNRLGVDGVEATTPTLIYWHHTQGF